MKQHSDLSCFGICTTALIESIAPIYQVESALSGPEDEQRYCPWEWEMGDGDTDFGPDVSRIRAELKNLRDDSELDICDEYLNAILDVLKELSSNGKLGSSADRRFLTLWLVGDYEEWVLKSSEVLNAPTVHAAVQESFE